MDMDAENEISTKLVTITAIRVAINFSRYPVHRLARKGSIDINIREGGVSGEDTKWDVDYSKKHGQPGPLAYKLDTLIINRRIEETRRPLSRILKLGSLSDICRELGLADSGKNRAHIKKSLYQNAFAGITAKTKYRLTDGSERTLEAAFTRYSIILTGEKLPSGHKADAVHIVLNDIFMQVINGAMTRPLDYDYLKSLSPAPQRFYELLSYRMYAALKYDRPRARLKYSDLCAYAPQTRHASWEKVRSQMTKVHRPHRESGYIGEINFNDTTDRDGLPDWEMHYQPGPKAYAEYRAFAKRGGPTVLEIEPFEAPALAAPDVPELERELIQRGVSAVVASSLVRRHDEARIRFQLECYDWLAEKHPEKIAEPGGYLNAAIEQDYAPPKRYVSRAERQRRQEAKLAKERQDKEERRRKQIEDAAERNTSAQLTAYRKTATAETLALLEADAIAQASEEIRRGLDEPFMKPFRKTQILRLTDEHIAGLIASGQLTVEPA